MSENPEDAPVDSSAQTAAPQPKLVIEDQGPYYASKTFSQIASWFVVVFCVVIIAGTVYLERLVQKEVKNEGKGAGADIHLQSKLAFGYHHLIEDLQNKKKKDSDKLDKNTEQFIDQLDSGPIAKRMAAAILLAEFLQPKDGLEKIKDVEELAEKEEYELSEYDQEVLDTTKRVLFSSLDKKDKKLFPALEEASPEDFEYLKKELFYAGKIASVIGKPDSAERTALETGAVRSMIGIGVIIFSGIGAFGFGTFFVLPCIVLFIFSKKILIRFQSPVSNNFLYLEAFALWIALFLGFQAMVGIAFGVLGVDGENIPRSYNLIASLFIFYTPMILSLMWLRFRHWNSSVMWKDIGFCSHGFFKDVFCGVTTYLSCLPLIAMGVVVTLGLTAIFGASGEKLGTFESPGGPSHPIQELVTDGTYLGIFFVFFMAAISAPIVEEIVFRGLFYRYLRDITQPSKLSVWIVSVAISSAVNGFVFAAIHPQGLLAIPVLMTLGMTMCFAREWREGLIAPMTIHALHNGTISVILTLFM